MIRNGPFRAMTRSVPGIQNCIHSLRALSWFAGVLLVLFASPLTAPGQATHFTRTIWRSKDGLPENSVQALAQDRDGYLWVGTAGGLTRFDGARFSPPIGGTKQTSSVNSFNCLLLSRDGTLWAGTDGGLLHITDPGVTKTYAAPDGLTGAVIHSIYQDSSNRLWVGTDSGLFLKEGERLVRVDQPAANGDFDVQAIAEDHEHHILAGGSRLISIGIGQIRNISMPGSQRQNQVNSILAATDGTLWIGTAGGLLRRVHGEFQRVPEIAATVRELRQTSDGTVWIGTQGKGLWTYWNGIVTRVGDKGLLPVDTVRSIFEDADHRIWIGTQNGLVRLVKSQIRVIPLPRFGNANNYGTVSGAPNGDVWMIAQEAFRVSRSTEIAVTFPGLRGAPIRSIYSAKDGSTWVGTKGRGVYHLAGIKTTPFSSMPRHFVISNFIRGFLESSRGEMWIATDNGLYCINTNGVAHYRTADGLANLSVRSLFEDRDHDIWIGTDHGLSRWHAGAFVQDAATTALREGKIWSILQDRRGIMWFGTRDNGLFRYRDNSIDHYSTAQGLMSNIVYQVLQDRTGRFWISSAETISSVPEEDMDGDAIRDNRLLSVTLYHMPYEGEGAQLSGGRYLSGYVAPDDTVWFPSNRGAIHIIVGSLDVERAPAVNITGIARDGENIQVNHDLQLPAGSTRLTFSFAPLFLGAQDGTRFSYRLEGFDHNWIFGGSGQTATYTNLPAGTYRFRVRAFDISHPELITEAALNFRQRPFLYQTWWFCIVCLLAVLGCGILAYTEHLRRVRMRFAAVLEERGRLAREMHDTLIQGCTGVSLLLEAIATQREDAPEHGDLLDAARAQILATINEARDAVWNLRRKKEEEIDLSYSLAALAEQATGAFGIPVVCERVDPMSGISGSTGHELLMVAREAIANAGTHGHPDWIRISASLEGMDLTLTVIDNGSGFTEATLSDTTGEHYGLVGMRERMHRIGGTLLIHSESGRGTEVVMRLRHTPEGSMLSAEDQEEYYSES
jgi:ligand-binding sensor domain-containing protein/two-component sensor histidine kinase